MKLHITQTRQFKRDRQALMNNITVEAANAFLDKYEKYVPGGSRTDKEVALIMAHKMRLALGTVIQINESRDWLKKHGYRDTIGALDPTIHYRNPNVS